MAINRFLPVSLSDLKERKWDSLDVVLITGDAYVDHPAYGAAVIGRVLENAGYKVGIIAQPDWKKKDDFMRLGKPGLFFGITAGNLDSTLSNYTLNRKIRRKDYYSPGGRSGLRPNRATLVYANRVRECFPGTAVVLGGIEASLTRLAHYYYWSNDVRRSLLLDAKADILVYGMGEKPVLEIARRLAAGEDIKSLDGIPGTVVARADKNPFENSVTLPSFESVAKDKEKFNEAFRLAYAEADPYHGKTIIQPHGNRFVIQFPPSLPLTTPEIDHIYALPYMRNWHPQYEHAGGVPGFETVRFSIISHRGCCAECSFCSLYAHQGRMIQSRSQESIVNEVKLLTRDPRFKGTISDIGGPTANMYQADCRLWHSEGACRNKKCISPEKCKGLKLGYQASIDLWDAVLALPKVKHLFIASGLRYDLLVDPEADRYLKRLCARHISGQLKVAPEHFSPKVLRLMNKPPQEVYEDFIRKFKAANAELGKKQYLVNYFIPSHPGTSLTEAVELGLYLAKQHIQPEQIQDFIPLPMTVSGAMYYTGKDPFSSQKVYVAKEFSERQMQRALLQYKEPKNRKWILRALDQLNRKDLVKIFLGPGSFRAKDQAPRDKPQAFEEADLQS